MTVLRLVSCDGTPADRDTIPLARCRAKYPASPGGTVGVLLEAWMHNWSSDFDAPGGRHDFCPACTRARRQAVPDPGGNRAAGQPKETS